MLHLNLAFLVQLSDTYRCYYSYIIITQKVTKNPVFSRDFLTMKENVSVDTHSGTHKLIQILKY